MAMDGGEALALVAAGVGGWVLGRRRTEHAQDEEYPMTETPDNASFADRVERGGHQIADRLGVAVGTGGVKAAVVSARGVRTVANMLAAGAGKSAAVLEGAGTRLGSVKDRGRRREGGNGSEGATSGDEPGAAAGAVDLADLSAAEPVPDLSAAYDAPDVVAGYEVQVDDLTPGGEDADELERGGEAVDELAPDEPGDVPPVL
jgi:hypothetical protein